MSRGSTVPPESPLLSTRHGHGVVKKGNMHENRTARNKSSRSLKDRCRYPFRLGKTCVYAIPVLVNVDESNSDSSSSPLLPLGMNLVRLRQRREVSDRPRDDVPVSMQVSVALRVRSDDPRDIASNRRFFR